MNIIINAPPTDGEAFHTAVVEMDRLISTLM